MPSPRPNRGEVWSADFGMVAKIRPAVVVSIPYADDDRAILGVTPLLYAVRSSRFELLRPTLLLTERFSYRGLPPCHPDTLSDDWVYCQPSSFDRWKMP